MHNYIAANDDLNANGNSYANNKCNAYDNSTEL